VVLLTLRLCIGRRDLSKSNRTDRLMMVQQYTHTLDVRKNCWTVDKPIVWFGISVFFRIAFARRHRLRFPPATSAWGSEREWNRDRVFYFK